MNMFSSLGRIIGITPRHAESSDTRQDIRRHDPDQESGKKKQKEDEPNFADMDDNAVVTVSALKIFLENFLKSMQTQPKNTIDNTENIKIPQPPEPQTSTSTPINGQAAHAANAYRHSAQTSPSPPPMAQQKSNNEGHEILGSEDIRTIHQLLKDLDILTDQNIEHLKIEKNESFLMSLVAAVETAKKG